MELRLKRLHLENFKCHKKLTIDFGGRSTSIYGDNATGKTSIYDGLTWLLFGKDSLGNGEKSLEIKPLRPDGSVEDHEAVTEVEAVFLADGEEVRLKRSFRELWTTRRGSTEPVYEGNTSEYFVDGVPCRASTYKAKVGELVDEEQFRLLTSVGYFPATLPWQKRREALFGLFGTLDDRQILETDGRFAPLLEAMGKRSLEDLKKILQQERKGLTGKRNEIPARISECEKTIADLAELDYDRAAAELAALETRKEALNTELLAIRQNTAVQGKELDLREIQGKLAALERENRDYRQEQERKMPDGEAIRRQLEENRKQLALAQQTMEGLKARQSRYAGKIEDIRSRWKAENAESYPGDDLCPTCGQKLPEAQIQAAAQAFESRKQARLQGLVKDADEYKELLALAEEEAKQTAESLKRRREVNRELEERAAQAQEHRGTIRDREGYAEEKAQLEQKAAKTREALEKLQADSQTASFGIRQRIAEVQGEMDRCNGILGKKSAYEYAQSRIGQLRDDAQEAAKALAQVERLLGLTEDFCRYKASFVEEGINRHFRLAKFRLYREQANGGVEDRCDVTYEGIPYTGLNNGMKINVGLDIINAFSQAYGVSVPIFIDNAESVTRLEACRGQVIRLVVSEQDKELRVHED